MKCILTISTLLLSHLLTAQTVRDSLLLKCLGQDNLVDEVIMQREVFRLQYLLTEVGEDSSLLTTIDGTTGDYYYPASLVKLPVVLATLEKMKLNGLHLDHYIRLENELMGGNSGFIRETRTQKVTFRELIENVLVVSDNEYFNVLYHFVTPEELNERLRSKGFEQSLIYRCFSGCSKEEQMNTVGLKVFNSRDSVVYVQKATSIDWDQVEEKFHTGDDRLIGKRHVAQGKVIEAPYDFNYNLELPLSELHQLMQQFILPEKFADSCRWNIRDEDRKFVLKSMQIFPKDIGSTRYSYNAFKIIAFGDPKRDNSRFTTYSKIGYSYGFISETAYVVDHVSGRSFFLTVSMYVNRNSVINDGNYQYSSVATPFMGRFTHILADLIATNALRSSQKK